MGRKKIWAYACNKDKEYIWSSKVNRERLYFIWEALKIRRDDPKEFSQMTFMSTQSNKDKRAELISDKRGFFRYKSDSVKETSPDNPDRDSFSHELAIAVLSEMETINFESKGQTYAITFDSLRKDDLKIRFENGAVYYPDLMGFFSQPAWLAQKWGGKVAIEVKVTHACEPIKIKDFGDHNIPIIEIFLRDSMRMKAEVDKVDPNEFQLENYYQFLQRKFSSVVFMEILSNPTMPKVYEKLLKDKNSELASLNKDKEQLNASLSRLNQQNENNISSVTTLQKEKSTLTQFTARLKKNLEEAEAESKALSNELTSERKSVIALNKEIARLKETDYHSMGFLKKLTKLFS